MSMYNSSTIICSASSAFRGRFVEKRILRFTQLERPLHQGRKGRLQDRASSLTIYTLLPSSSLQTRTQQIQIKSISHFHIMTYRYCTVYRNSVMILLLPTQTLITTRKELLDCALKREKRERLFFDSAGSRRTTGQDISFAILWSKNFPVIPSHSTNCHHFQDLANDTFWNF